MWRFAALIWTDAQHGTVPELGPIAHGRSRRQKRYSSQVIPINRNFGCYILPTPPRAMAVATGQSEISPVFSSSLTYRSGSPDSCLSLASRKHSESRVSLAIISARSLTVHKSYSYPIPHQPCGGYPVSVMEALYAAPFCVIHAPNLRMRKPSWLKQPSPMTVYAFVLLSYFLVCGGIIYDVIVEPPSIGSTVDEHGHSKPVSRTQSKSSEF